MKKFDFIWIFRTIVLMLLVAILVIVVLILKRVNECCNCKEEVACLREQVKSLSDMSFSLDTIEFYDKINHKKCFFVTIDTIKKSEKSKTSLMIYCDICPEKETKKVSVVSKKVNETPSKIVIKKESVQKDTCIVISKIMVPEPYLPKNVVPDTLKIKVEKTTSEGVSSLYSSTSVLPTYYDGVKNTSEFNYNFKPDLHIEESIAKAKTHLIIGATAATAGAITYASTMFSEIPTFVEYNGLGYFDPMNKYYRHNLLSREHLRTLKTLRAVGIGMGVLGGIEVIHGICLLKNAKVDISPQRITFSYSF